VDLKDNSMNRGFGNLLFRLTPNEMGGSAQALGKSSPSGGISPRVYSRPINKFEQFAMAQIVLVISFMRRNLRVFVLASLTTSSVAACDVSGSTDSICNESGTMCRVNSSEKGVDQRLDDLDIICETTFILSGTFTESRAQPADQNGCWEVGEWVVNWDVDFAGCTPAPELADSFKYEGVRGSSNDGDNIDSGFTFLNEPNNQRVHLKVTSASDGLCHANFEHYGDKGNNNVLISFNPTLEADGTLSGEGSWALYRDDPIWF